MKKCIICNSEISEEAKTCPVCGFQTKYPSPMSENKYRNWLSTVAEPYQMKYQLGQLQRELAELRQTVNDMKQGNGQGNNITYEVDKLKRVLRDFSVENLYLKQEVVQVSPENLDEESAQKWFQKGKKYYDKEEYEKAVEWFCKAAEQYYTAAQNCIDAQLRLGYCYRWGKGVEMNLQEAMNWYIKAAENGHTGAKYALEKLQS